MKFVPNAQHLRLIVIWYGLRKIIKIALKVNRRVVNPCRIVPDVYHRRRYGEGIWHHPGAIGSELERIGHIEAADECACGDGFYFHYAGTGVMRRDLTRAYVYIEFYELTYA